jgi:EmrB/QacA subfamily drug resistance transporter
MGLAVFVIANDFSAINVAIPRIEEDFDTSVTTAQWVVNAYALTFGVLIVTGGRLADLFGRRRAFFIGSAIFAVASVAGGAAPTEAALIFFRVVMGIGGALMWPAILGMTFAALPAEKAGLAGGLILGAAGIGNAAGPLIGGVLTDLLSWRWIFFLNLPVTAFACFVTWREVHQPQPEIAEKRMDYAGILTVSTGLVALLLAFDQALDWGWEDPRIIGLLIASAVLLASFAAIELRVGERALVPRDVFANREFALTCVVILLMSTVFFASLLFLPQAMQKTLDMSPIMTGVGLLPMLAVFACVSFVAGPLYERLGPKVLLSLGALCLTVGPALISILVDHGTYLALVPGMVVTGLGVGVFYPTATTFGVTALDESRSSLAGAIIYMFQIAGGAVGLGLTTTIITEAARDGTFTDGLETGFHLDAAIAFVGLLVAVFFLGRQARSNG